MSTHIISVETLQCDQCHRNQREDHIEFADSHYRDHKDTTEICMECVAEGYYICKTCGGIHALGDACHKFSGGYYICKACGEIHAGGEKCHKFSEGGQ